MESRGEWHLERAWKLVPFSQAFLALRISSTWLFLSLYLRNGISPAISVNQNITALSDLGPPNVNEGSQKGKQYLRSSRCCHPSMVIAKELEVGDVRNQNNKMLAPDS